MAQPRERAPYSAIVDRPPLPPLPGGNRIIFWTIVNVEVWDITRPMPRMLLMPPQGQVRFPDVGNWAWHEYGNRVGFWRFYELFERLGIKPSLSINGRICIDYPRIAEATAKAGWEMLGHSYDQQPIHVEHEPEAMIQKTLDVLEKHTGQRPIGWLSPGFGQTFQSSDWLAAAGVKYTCEYPLDDEPTRLHTKHGPLVSLPYPIECQDVTTLAVQTQEAQYFARKCIDAFDQLYKESEKRPKVFSIAIHPYAAGQAHAFKYLEQIYDHVLKQKGVLVWNGREMYEQWYLKNPEKFVGAPL